jgi:hypothetical protein
MTITAQTLPISVPLVVCPLVRVVVVNMGTQYIYTGAARWLGGRRTSVRHEILYVVVSLTQVGLD